MGQSFTHEGCPGRKAVIPRVGSARPRVVGGGVERPALRQEVLLDEPEALIPADLAVEDVG